MSVQYVGLWCMWINWQFLQCQKVGCRNFSRSQIWGNGRAAFQDFYSCFSNSLVKDLGTCLIEKMVQLLFLYCIFLWLINLSDLLECIKYMWVHVGVNTIRDNKKLLKVKQNATKGKYTSFNISQCCSCQQIIGATKLGSTQTKETCSLYHKLSLTVITSSTITMEN